MRIDINRALCCGLMVLLMSAAQPGAAADWTIVVEDAYSRALPEAALYLTGGPGRGSRAAGSAEVQQRNRKFEPGITVVQTGTAMTFPNRDTIRHSVYSFSRAKSFQLKMFPGKTAEPIVFDQPGIVTVGCNIHDEMAAWILVVDTPLVGKADSKGRFVFRDLKPGTYQLFAWYPGLDAASRQQTIVVDAAQPGEVRVHLDVMPIEAEAQS